MLAKRTFNARAHAYAKKKEYDLAIKDYSKVIRLKPVSGWCYKQK